jgi:hypothetical protein
MVVTEHKFLQPSRIRMTLLWRGHNLAFGFLQGMEISVAAVAEKSAPGRTTRKPGIVLTASSRLWLWLKGVIGRQQFGTMSGYEQSLRGFADVFDLFDQERNTK